jgi:peptide/nickel transport system ATP-binding protein
MMPALLEIDGLDIDYRVGGQWQSAVRGVSLTLQPGEILGLVGESGCGKSTLARGIIRLLPRNGRVAAGSIRFEGRDILTLGEGELLATRRARISMIFQGAMNVLDPVYTIGAQIVEAIATHRPGESRRAMWRQAEHLLEGVGIEKSRARAYPHELSGGMRQRVGIAMAIALEPSLVIADEPTTALDVISQDNVLARLTSLQKARAFSMILVSHDMGVIAETCDRVAVMYAGSIVELGSVRDIFHRPAHPYSIGLRGAIQAIDQSTPPVAIPGTPPAGSQRDAGCQFRQRCPFRTERCAAPVPWTPVGDDHHILCHYPEKQTQFRDDGTRTDTWERVAERLRATPTAA